MSQGSILNLNLKELKDYFKEKDIFLFHAEQIFNWIYKKDILDFEKMTDMSLELRQQLKKDFCISQLKIVTIQKSSDGTEKFLFQLEDKELIESVWIPAKARNTTCLSSQVGCKFKCHFCASGMKGFKRNLSSAEVISQVLLIKNRHLKERISNIVFMGTGEPLDNYEQVIKSIRIINEPQGLNIGARKITLSTCGLIPQIEKLSREGLQFELSISLHAADNKRRDFLMPINKKYPLEKLIETAKNYATKTKRQITFEYVLIKDINSDIRQAQLLSKLLKDLNCKINIILYNPIDGFEFKSPTKHEIHLFKQTLSREGINVTIRKARGQDIKAACGQLRVILLR